jgi:hypothetical protein
VLQNVPHLDCKTSLIVSTFDISQETEHKSLTKMSYVDLLVDLLVDDRINQSPAEVTSRLCSNDLGKCDTSKLLLTTFIASDPRWLDSKSQKIQKTHTA